MHHTHHHRDTTKLHAENVEITENITLKENRTRTKLERECSKLKNVYREWKDARQLGVERVFTQRKKSIETHYIVKW